MTNRMVGTPRCGVTARRAGGTMHNTTSGHVGGAAIRGADGGGTQPSLRSYGEQDSTCEERRLWHHEAKRFTYE
ncbi:MAG TPA: hypothetical protein VH280_05380 [Verrucomicrobiae bacterium]|jgi:hypothetical protein|nr:hypothetical protein [Verrucomicrobiae bacterium]